MREILGTTAFFLALGVALTGCGSHSHPRPESLSTGPPPGPVLGRVLPAEYRLHVGDRVSLLVLDQADLSVTVPVSPDGLIHAPGAGPVPAAGRTTEEIAADLRDKLRRILRYPEVSVILSAYADQVVYVFGEVHSPGAGTYVPQMTALHALGNAGGVNNRANLHSVLVLRRGGPTELDVYRVDLDDAVDGEPQARDLFLQPFDVVYVPRSWIGEVNVFADRFFRQNIAPFTAYIEGWEAFHLDRIRTYAK